MPPVVKNLLIINALMFVGTQIIDSKFGFDLTQYLALYYPESNYFNPYQLLTHIFMHGSLMHIISNMFALWMFGTAIENLWGSKRFLFYYLFTGIGAASLHLLINWYRINELQTVISSYHNSASPQSFTKIIIDYFPEYKQGIADFIQRWTASPADERFKFETFKFLNEQLIGRIDTPTVGASGAVFGILLAFGMMFPNSMIYIYFFFPLKAKYFVMIYGLFELYSGYNNQPGDNIAHFAHLGGMLFGFILIKIWQKKRFKT